jgi:hypothetical protein
MKHTESPWTASQFLPGKNYVVMSTDQVPVVIGSVITKADAEHIVACVNACEGINPKAVPDLLKACKVLLEDCEMALSNTWDRSNDGFEDSSHILRSALIKALGEKQFLATQNSMQLENV